MDLLSGMAAMAAKGCRCVSAGLRSLRRRCTQGTEYISLGDGTRTARLMKTAVDRNDSSNLIASSVSGGEWKDNPQSSLGCFLCQLQSSLGGSLLPLQPLTDDHRLLMGRSHRYG